MGKAEVNFVVRFLAASMQQCTLNRLRAVREGTGTPWDFLSYVFSCKNHKALNPVMQNITAALVQCEGKSCGCVWCR